MRNTKASNTTDKRVRTNANNTNERLRKKDKADSTEVERVSKKDKANNNTDKNDKSKQRLNVS